jgi:hypothetical protein
MVAPSNQPCACAAVEDEASLGAAPDEPSGVPKPDFRRSE